VNAAAICRWMVACIHGDKSQEERDVVLRGTLCDTLLIDVHCVLLFALYLCIFRVFTHCHKSVLSLLSCMCDIKGCVCVCVCVCVCDGSVLCVLCFCADLLPFK